MAGHKPFRELAKSLPQPETLFARDWLTLSRTRYKRGTVWEARGLVGPLWYCHSVGKRHLRLAGGLNR